ncbi:hypothetical protein [Phaeobacter inhibens]|uniref:hypothetical protein n=1 Tax=Phaeobacter inhibens TaxID=221822 RepID=UPI0021A4B29D|nr:hypothetical protein [Phaeobacter inhibens]UWS07524.1 hypothetical protein K4K98_14975 [Phaeobacter inhibens]
MVDLTLIHTAEVHVASFDALAGAAKLHHIVRPDWLEQAQDGIDDALRQEITAEIQRLTGPVLCTCTTLGELAESAGATRLDWPMMQAAAQIGGPVLIAYCLESTRAPSTALLERAFSDLGKSAEIRTLPLTGLWSHFTAGETDLFHKQIATWVSTSLALVADTSCVVLAQASMAGAAALIETEIPVLTSPAIAMQNLTGAD